MPRTDIHSLSDDSRIWVFGVSPALDDAKRARMLEQVDLFLRDWAAHNVLVTSARQVLHDSFLLIAVDKRSETSGCSIDRMFGLLRQLERDLGVKILDPSLVFVRHGDGHVLYRAYWATDWLSPHRNRVAACWRLGDATLGRLLGPDAKSLPASVPPTNRKSAASRPAATRPNGTHRSNRPRSR